MHKKAIGIDISKLTFDVCLRVGEKEFTAKFDNNKNGFRKFTTWLKKKDARGVHICLEATGRYGNDFAEHMFDLSYPVSVVNPIRIKNHARSRMERNKTDAIDSKVIAHFCQTQKPDLWSPLPEQVKELQALTRYLVSLKEERTRIKNRLKSGVSSDFVIMNLEDQKASLDTKIKATEKEINSHVKNHPDLKEKHDLLVSIKGIATTTATQFLAEVPDVTLFEKVEQLVAFAGLPPKTTQSGTSVRKRGGINKMGNKRLRTALYMPAMVAMRHNSIVIDVAERLRKRGLCEMVIIVACMRKLLHLMFGVLKTGLLFDPNYLVNRQNTA